jgi:hypothetical protein
MIVAQHMDCTFMRRVTVIQIAADRAHNDCRQPIQFVFIEGIFKCGA